MQLIEGMNVLVGKNGITNTTRESYFLARQCNLPVKTFIYREDNRLKNSNDVLEIIREYDVNNVDIKFSDDIDETKSIFIYNNHAYDFENERQTINDICISEFDRDDAFVAKNKVFKIGY